MSRVTIVLDANILIRAVLGTRVRELIQAHAATVTFRSMEGCNSQRCGALKCVMRTIGPCWRVP